MLLESVPTATTQHYLSFPEQSLEQDQAEGTFSGITNPSVKQHTE